MASRRSIFWLSIFLLSGCTKAEPKPEASPKDEAVASTKDDSPAKKKQKPKGPSADDDDGADPPAKKKAAAQGDDGDDDNAPSAPAAKTATGFALRVVTKPGSPKASMVLDYLLDGAKKTAMLESVDVGGEGALAGGEAITFDAAGKHAKIASPNVGDDDFDDKPVIAHLPKDALARGGVVTNGQKAYFEFTIYSVLRVDDGHVRVVRQEWQSNGDGKPEAEKTFAPFGL